VGKRVKFDLGSISLDEDSPAAKTLKFLKREDYMKFRDALLYAAINQFYLTYLRLEGAPQTEIDAAEQMIQSSISYYSQFLVPSQQITSTVDPVEPKTDLPSKDFDNFDNF
jgi:hypothetical protein